MDRPGELPRRVHRPSHRGQPAAPYQGRGDQHARRRLRSGYLTGTRDFQTPYLRAYFANQGVADENIHLVSAELTLATLVPRLAHLQPLAARWLRHEPR